MKFIEAEYYGFCDPVVPCRETETRHCPAILAPDHCPVGKCARFQISKEEAKDLWLPEIDR